MDKKKQSKKINPDGPLHKWGEPEGVADYMKKTPGQKKVAEAKYSVDVEGLPRFYMDSDSPAKVKVALRKLLKKASSIDAVARVPDATIKADLRHRLKTGETDKRYVDEKLNPNMGAGEYVKDFKDSDAPQFKGKSDKEKQKMAIAAYLAARKEKAMKEEAAWHKKDDEQKAKGKDHQTLHYTTRGGQKMKTAVHKDKAFAAVGHFRRQGHTDVRLGEGWRSGGGGHRDPFKAAARSAKYKELSHEYEDEKKLARLKQMRKTQQQKKEEVDEGSSFEKSKKAAMNNPNRATSKEISNHNTAMRNKALGQPHNKDHILKIKNVHGYAIKEEEVEISVSDYKKKTGKKTVSLKHLTKNTHINPFKEEVGLDEGAQHKKAAKDLQAYAKKSGGIDKDDFLMAAKLLNDGKMRDLKKFMRSMDTDPRDGVITILRKNGIKESVEETKMEEGMVRAVATAKRMAGNMTGAVKKIDKMKSKKQGGDFSDNPRVQKKLLKHNEGMESWNEFLESSCGGSYKSKKKKAMKEEQKLSPAQKKHMDTDKDGDIDASDMKNLRNKKKS